MGAGDPQERRGRPFQLIPGHEGHGNLTFETFLHKTEVGTALRHATTPIQSTNQPANTTTSSSVHYFCGILRILA
ncbi:hypothetical protein Pmani_021513 [Petrolisthes manimaculis]|uniref:Uncharacterized protein n=1 Tax=Petrolisthes manimaculis TaxID=1843537 RepID=A0AAE1U5E2_9EUCA|nr:hypothetical protein Pmani_021513 [Petrolisthes manimaculis]